MERVMRRIIDFDCAGDRLVGTLDDGAGNTGLLIVSGGNEIRSGAYSGQAMAAHFAAKGCPVFRYDRRGVGDSEGVNGGFESSATDIATAVSAFRTAAPHINRLVAFGNCDAATALAFFHADVQIEALIMANPWTIEVTATDDAATSPSAAAIRARYWARIKNPRSLFDLLSGKIDLRKLAGGLAKATTKEAPSTLATRLAETLATVRVPVEILIASKDTTALAFMAAWKTRMFDAAQNLTAIRVSAIDSASHSFADPVSRDWLNRRIMECLERED
jgi:exosortase A-associated hydrolase 1